MSVEIDNDELVYTPDEGEPVRIPYADVRAAIASHALDMIDGAAITLFAVCPTADDDTPVLPPVAVFNSEASANLFVGDVAKLGTWRISHTGAEHIASKALVEG
jgi:hypothetical protein